MRNLYEPLGFTFPVSLSEVRVALSQHSNVPEDLRSACQHILLEPTRKTIYDRHWWTIYRVNQIRHGLGLQSSAQWTAAKVVGFSHDQELSTWRRLQVLAAKRQAHSDSESNAGTKAASGCLLFVGISFVVLFLLIRPFANTNSSPAPQNSSENSDANERPKFDFPQTEGSFSGRVPPRSIAQSSDAYLSAQPLPATGALGYSAATVTDAPFKVHTPSQGRHTFVKLIRWQDRYKNKPLAVQTFFIRSGEILDTKVPLGDYQVRYATGDTWYGESDLFGSNTKAYVADGQFRFYSVGNSLMGHEIELITQVGGNLDTDAIPLSRF